MATMLKGTEYNIIYNNIDGIIIRGNIMEITNRMIALSLFKECPLINIELQDKHSEDYEYLLWRDGNNIEEYRILTDSEADEAWQESLENYIEECILPEIPKLARNYFDSERWIKDAKIDGRGQNLAHYDGNENEETFTLNGDELTYYIYRM